MADGSFLVVPFDRNADGKLQPGAPARLATEDEAEFAAELFVNFHAGIAVIGDPDDEFAEPRLVQTFGRIPSRTLAIFDIEATSRFSGRSVARSRKLKLRPVGKGTENGRRPASLSALCWRS